MSDEVAQPRPLRPLLLSLVAAIALLALAFASAPAARADEFPGAPWKRLTGYITVKDGTQLRYSVVLPNATGKFPTILSYAGYDNGSIGDADDLDRYNIDAKEFVRRGYAFMGLNVRGSGCSDGAPFVTFDPKWGGDGATAVEWAARQPWSTGKVGMTGGSFNGLTQLFVAAHRPKGLAAIAPISVVVDPLRDVSSPGGVTNYLFPEGWWTANLRPAWLKVQRIARAEGDRRCVAAVDRNLAEAVTPPQSQAEHPFLDSFNRTHSLEGKTKRIDVPTLSLEKFQDGQTGVRGGYYQETVPPGKMWYAGMNGLHNSPPDRYMKQMVYPFFAHFVKGIRNDFQKRPHTTIWEGVHAPRWYPPHQDGFETAAGEPYKVYKLKHYPPRTKRIALNLRSHGRLTWRKAGSGERPDRYEYPVPGPAVNSIAAPGAAAAWGALSEEWREGSLAYTSHKLKRPLTLFGSASANLWVSTTAPDADLQVTVTDLRPNGKEQYVQRGWLRLSDRAIDRKLSNPTRPVLKMTEGAVSMPPKGKPVKARLEINKFSHIFKRGSRLRIWIDAPSTTGLTGFTTKTDPGVNRIFHSRKRPSKIVFGKLPVKAPDTQRPLCGTVLNMPCRPDPLQGG